MATDVINMSFRDDVGPTTAFEPSRRSLGGFEQRAPEVEAPVPAALPDAADDAGLRPKGKAISGIDYGLD